MESKLPVLVFLLLLMIDSGSPKPKGRDKSMKHLTFICGGDHVGPAPPLRPHGSRNKPTTADDGLDMFPNDPIQWTENRVIETLVYLDGPMIRRLERENYTNNNADTNHTGIEMYLLKLQSQCNDLFRPLNISIQFIRWVDLEAEAGYALPIDKGNPGGKMFKKFQKYMQLRNRKHPWGRSNPQPDDVLLLSGVSGVGENQSIYGTHNIGDLCITNAVRSFTVMDHEELDWIPYTLVHEVAHGMGVDHVTNEGCPECIEQKYCMMLERHDYRDKKLIIFSSCAIEGLRFNDFSRNCTFLHRIDHRSSLNPLPTTSPPTEPPETSPPTEPPETGGSSYSVVAIIFVAIFVVLAVFIIGFCFKKRNLLKELLLYGDNSLQLHRMSL